MSQVNVPKGLKAPLLNPWHTSSNLGYQRQGRPFIFFFKAVRQPEFTQIWLSFQIFEDRYISTYYFYLYYF